MFTGFVAAFSFFNCQRWEYTLFLDNLQEIKAGHLRGRQGGA